MAGFKIQESKKRAKLSINSMLLECVMICGIDLLYLIFVLSQVKTINIYYSNKPVPSVVELKNK